VCAYPVERSITRESTVGSKVLGETGQPMTSSELIEVMAKKGLWSSPNGQMRAATLYAAQSALKLRMAATWLHNAMHFEMFVLTEPSQVETKSHFAKWTEPGSNRRPPDFQCFLANPRAFAGVRRCKDVASFSRLPFASVRERPGTWLQLGCKFNRNTTGRKKQIVLTVEELNAKLRCTGTPGMDRQHQVQR
jgi:hypothetical protein